MLAVVGGVLLACNSGEGPSQYERVAAQTPALSSQVLRTVTSATTLVLVAHRQVTFGNLLRVEHGSGSGAWMATLDGEAIVVTNAHVLRQKGQAWPAFLEVVFDSNRGVRERRSARIVAADEERDLALLAVEAPREVRRLSLGPARTLAEGTPLYVSGFPFGPQLAVDGVLPRSTLNPGASTRRRFWDLEIPRSFQSLVAGINPGNSGGPVVDEQGRLRGVAVAHLPGTIGSFMIPAEELRDFISETLPDAEFTWDGAPPTRGPTPPAQPNDIRRIAAATVQVRAGDQSSSGFVIARQGADAIVITNHRTVHTDAGTPQAAIGVRAVTADGALHVGRGRVLRASGEDDLAMVRVTGLPELPVLTPADGTDLAATDPIWVLGLEERGSTGEWRGSIRRGAISGLRDDRGMEVALLQIDLGITAQNTGGPVVDAQGRLIGLAVRTHPTSNVSVAVPGVRLKDLLAGALRGGGLRVQHDGIDRCLLRLYLEVDDPLGLVTQANLIALSPAVDLWTMEGSRTVMEEGLTLRSAPIQNGVAEINALLEPCHPGTRHFQVSIERSDGSARSSRIFPAEVGADVLTPFRGTYQAGDGTINEWAMRGLAKERFPSWTHRRCRPGEFEKCKLHCSADLNCVLLADMYLLGSGGARRDPSFARKVYAQTCETGEVEACERMVSLYPEGTPGRPDTKAVLAAHQRLCRVGRLSSCFAENLSVWREASSVEAERAATDRFRALCDGGEPRSCVMVGLAYQTGRGVEEPGAGWAEHHYQRACHSELELGCHNLALLKLQGAPDPKEAAWSLKLLEGTCARGFGPSCGALAARSTAAGSAQAVLERACRIGVEEACPQLAGAAQAPPGTPLEPTFTTLPRGLQAAVAAAAAEEAQAKVEAIAQLTHPRQFKGLEKYADVGQLLVEVGVTGTVPHAAARAAVLRAFQGAGRCTLSRLNLDPRWMRSKRARAQVKVAYAINGQRVTGTRLLANTTRDRVIGSCVQSVVRAGLRLDPAPNQQGEILLTVDVLRD